MTFRHRAGVSPYTSPFGFAETCVFVKQSPGPFHCGSLFSEHSFSRSYGVNMPSSLTTLLPLALGSSPHLPVSVCGTGAFNIPRGFSRHGLRMLPYFVFSVPFARVYQRPGHASPMCLPRLNYWRLRNFHRICIGYAFRPRLSSRLTQGGRTSPWKPWIFGHYDSHAILATYSGILSSVTSTSPSGNASPVTQRSPTHPPFGVCLSFGYIL